MKESFAWQDPYPLPSSPEEMLEYILRDLETLHPGDKLWIRVHDDKRPWGIVYTTSTANYL